MPSLRELLQQLRGGEEAERLRQAKAAREAMEEAARKEWERVESLRQIRPIMQELKRNAKLSLRPLLEMVKRTYLGGNGMIELDEYDYRDKRLKQESTPSAKEGEYEDLSDLNDPHFKEKFSKGSYARVSLDWKEIYVDPHFHLALSLFVDGSISVCGGRREEEKVTRIDDPEWKTTVENKVFELIKSGACHISSSRGSGSSPADTDSWSWS